MVTIVYVELTNMINKQVIERIISKNPFKENFGSEKYHIYINYGDSAIEECEVTLTVLDTCLEVYDRDDKGIIWIPYSQITEISIMDDIPEQED